MRVNPANLISIFRVCLIFVAVYFLVEVGGAEGSFFAISITAFAILLDAVDGRVARAFGFEGEVGKLTDLYADHIVANTVWVSLAYLDLVSVWVPLITTTRDLTVDWFRQADTACTDLNGFEQVKGSSLSWVVSSRVMRAFYGILKLCAWSGAFLSIFMPINIQFIVWTTVLVCILRAVPSLSVSWRYVVFARPAG